METTEELNAGATETDRALMQVIGERVKKLREDATERLSQSGLADALTERGIKIKQGQIGHIESGNRLPSVPLLYAIADFYSTSIDYITGRTKNPSSIADIEEDLQTGGVSGRLGEKYKQLPATRQEEVYKFVLAQEALARNDVAALDPDTQKFVKALLDSFEKRIGTKALELTLDELAREFPDLSLGLVGRGQSPKKKRG